MWPLLVVLPEPLLRLLSHFCQTLKDKHVEHCFPVAAVESFDEAVLHRSSWLNELEQHAVLLGPVSERRRDQLWSIVQSQFERIAALSGYPIQRSHHAFRGQVEVHFDRQHFAIEIIYYVEGTKTPTAPQS